MFIINRDYYNSILKLVNKVSENNISKTSNLKNDNKYSLYCNLDGNLKSQCSPPALKYTDIGNLIGFKHLEQMVFESLIIKHPEIDKTYCIDTYKASKILRYEKNIFTKIFSDYPYIVSSASLVLSIITLIINILK